MCAAQPARPPKGLGRRISTGFGAKYLDLEELIDSYGVADVPVHLPLTGIYYGPRYTQCSCIHKAECICCCESLHGCMSRSLQLHVSKKILAAFDSSYCRHGQIASILWKIFRLIEPLATMVTSLWIYCPDTFHIYFF